MKRGQSVLCDKNASGPGMTDQRASKANILTRPSTTGVIGPPIDDRAGYEGHCSGCFMILGPRALPAPECAPCFTSYLGRDGRAT
jgi:hypothetical protein